MSRRKQSKPKSVRDCDGEGQTAEQSTIEKQQISDRNSPSNQSQGDDAAADERSCVVNNAPKTNTSQTPDEKLPDDTAMTILNHGTKVSAADACIASVAAEESATDTNDAAMMDGDSDSFSSEKTNEPKEKIIASLEAKNKAAAKILPVSLDTGDHAYICPICNETMEDSHTLTVHIRNHNSKAPSCHSCTICGKTLCSQSSLDRHMLVHSGERPFRCQVCDLSFTTNGNMHRHMRVHEKEFSKSPGSLKVLLDASLQPVYNQTPGQNSADRARSRKRRSGLASLVDNFMEKRQKTEDGMSVTDALRKKLFQNGVIKKEPEVDAKTSVEGELEQLHCPVCLKTFLCKNGLESHVETSHPDYSFKCLICNLSFPNHRTLRSHNTNVHKDSCQNGVTIPVGFHELAFADFSATKFPLIAQQWCEDNTRRSSSSFHKFDCSVCRKAFPCAESLDLHVKSSHRSVACDLCSVTLVDQDALAKHKQAVHATRMLNFEEPQQKESNERKEKFLSMLQLFEKNEQTNLSDASVSSNETEKEPSDANDYFTKVNDIKKTHASRSFTEENNNNSSDFADIQKIIQTANSSTLPPLSATPTAAPAFHELFKKTAQIKDRSDDDSEGLPMLDFDDDDDSTSEEEIAGKSTPNKSPNKFSCKYCSFSFETFNSLKVHMRAHFGLSPYKCNMCPYSSADKTTLIRHLRTHNGERPFQCKICQYAFTTKANCERHVRKKHNKETKEEIDEAVGYNEEIEEISPKFAESFNSPDTMCKYCGQDFKFYRALKHHLRSHSSCRLKPFVCMVCDIGFSTKANCIRHIQKRHDEIEPSQIETNIRTNLPPVRYDNSEHSSPGHSPPPSAAAAAAAAAVAIYPQTQTAATQAAPPPAHVAARLPHPSILPVCPSGKIVQSAAAKLDAPLDFSKKTLTESPTAILHAIKPEPMDDQPMDLSVPSKGAVAMPTIPRPVPIHPAFNILPFMGSLAGNMSEVNTPSTLMQARVYKCPVCHLQFNQDSKLQLHVKMHATSRPFQCTFCPAGFTVKSNLDIHVRTRHENGAGSSFTPSRNKFVSPNLKMVNKRSSSGFSYLRPKYPTLANSISADLDLKFSSVSDTSSDLASVSKMLDAASVSLLIGQPKSASLPETNLQPKEDEKDLVIMDDGHMIEIKKEGNHQRREVADYCSSADASSSPDKTPRKKRNSYANAPNRVSCPYCSRTFPWISSLRRHILTHTGQKPYKCPECPVHFSTKSNRERHLLRKHGLNPANPNTRQIMDRPYKCQLCVFSSFSKPEKLIHHYKSKHPGNDPPSNIHEMTVEMWLTSPNRPVHLDESEDGALVINEDDDAWSDDEEDDESSPEKTCSRSPSVEDDLIKREEDSANEDDEDMPMDTSLGTEERETPEPANRRLLEHFTRSPSPTLLRSSLARPSPGRTTVINPERDNYNVDKILDCWQCSQHYATRKLLLRHLKEHNSDFPFKCYLCDASYLTRKECLDHKVEKHADDWVMLKARNKIDELGEFVITMERLTEVADEEINTTRMKEVRIGNGDETTIMAAERKVFCALCPKKFWSLQDLRRHMRSHTGEKPFECDICGRYFTLKHSMMRHRRKHTEADYRPYIPPRPTLMSDGVITPDMSYMGGNDSNDDCRSTASPDNDHFMSARDRLSVNSSPVSLLPTSALVTSAPLTKAAPPPVVPAVVSSGLLDDNGGDMLHNLLGVDNSAIEQMLNTGSAAAAAELLGMK